jgi:hypothetical protein
VKRRKPGNVDEELQIARALRDALFAEREAIERLSPDRQRRIFARIEKILGLLEKIESLELRRAELISLQRQIRAQAAAKKS